ncbi:hypothetical protein C8T65DRAFT_626515 [Cerioporus squamosus]|nr:hypothetical protein C8T65DRAFT_626515 [Cerioporus squamosus]
MMQEENMRLQQELRELAHRRMESKEVAAVRDGLHSPAGRDAPPPKNLDLTEARTNVEHVRFALLIVELIRC